MRFRDYYRQGNVALSFELFPPKTEKGMLALQRRLPKLVDLAPDFMTVTYGAMGSTREKTLDIVCRIKNEYAMETAHHLTCVGADQSQIQLQIDEIQKNGIENIVALRGDPPQGSESFEAVDGGYANACQLVEHIRRDTDMGVAVAGYPEKHIEAPDSQTDLLHLKHKVDCGADVVITQLFYDNASFFDFRERCRDQGIQVPIVPGLLPILSVKQIKRISQLCGCIIPPRLKEELNEAAHDPERVHEIGVRHTVEQALELLDNHVAGIHFYVLNRYFHIAEIIQQIRERRKEAAPSATKESQGVSS